MEYHMEKLTLTPGTVMAPLPTALVSCGNMENSNIITIAWTGIINTRPPMTYISVRPERYSYAIIKQHGEFVINFATERTAKRADLCGMKTGAKTDKFKMCGFTKIAADSLCDCPVIAECPINLECKVKDIIHLGSHDMFLAEIKAIRADESLIDSRGRLLMHKAGIIGYSHGEYIALGKKLGSFGFSVSKKRAK